MFFQSLSKKIVKHKFTSALRQCLCLLFAAVSATHHSANSLRWCWRLRLLFCSTSAFCQLAPPCCAAASCCPPAHSPPSLAVPPPLVTTLPWLHPSRLVGCCISQRLSLSLLLRLRPVPRPPPFITSQPFVPPLSFGWLLRCPAPQPPSCCNSAWCLGASC